MENLKKKLEDGIFSIKAQNNQCVNQQKTQERTFFMEEEEEPHPFWSVFDYDGKDIALNDDKLCMNCEVKVGDLKCSRCNIHT